MSDESGPVRFAFGESTGPRLFDEGAPDVPEQDALFVLWSYLPRALSMRMGNWCFFCSEIGRVLHFLIKDVLIGSCRTCCNLLHLDERSKRVRQLERPILGDFIEQLRIKVNHSRSERA